MVSLASAPDIPSDKYKAVLVFAENLEVSELVQLEQKLAQRLRQTGISADGATSLFPAGSEITDLEKAQIIRQRGFDAVLFFRIDRKDVVEKYFGQLTVNPFAEEIVQYYSNSLFSMGRSRNHNDIVKEDGSVYRPNYLLLGQAELQDVSTSKIVWVAKTEALGDVSTSTMAVLFNETAQQIASKLEQDGVI